MSTKLYDHVCKLCNTIWEDWGTSLSDESPCPKCGQPQPGVHLRLNFKLDGCDPAFPTAWDRWAIDHERRSREAAKRGEWYNDE